MIEVKHVSKTLKDHQVLKDVSVTFEAGHIYGIYGENGSGKTIFLRALAGLLIPDQGTIAYDGKILHQDIASVFRPRESCLAQGKSSLHKVNQCRAEQHPDHS